MADKILRYAEFNQEGVGGTDYGDEQTQGTGTHEDIMSASLDVADDASMMYDGGIGRSPRVYRPGFYSPEGSVVFAPRLASLGTYLFWALGDGSITEMWGAEGVILPSFNTRIGKDLFEHLFVGCNINTLNLSASDSFIEMDLGIVAQKDAKKNLQEISDLSLGDISPLAFHEISISAGPESHDVREMTLSIVNNIDSDSGRGIGSRFPYGMRCSGRDTTIDFVLYFDSTGELENFWGTSTGPSESSVPNEFSLEFELKPADAEPGDTLITIELPKCIYTDSTLEPSGRDRLEQSVSAVALLDTFAVDSKDSEIKVTVGTVGT